ncbi:hypothetical protein [Streptomyces sp. NPDC093598]|uniref:hypothetical protein n=1 Tax=Streptomyces sp. NPDC093598 TaxID=3366046 RepID=UPI00382EFF2E
MFLYQWACLALAGRTVGNALTGLKVTPNLPCRLRAARRAALPVLSPGRRSLADRIAGTAVTGIGLSRPVATPPARTS